MKMKIMSMKAVAVLAVTIWTVSSPVLAGLLESCEQSAENTFCRDLDNGGDANAVCETAGQTCTCTGAYKVNGDSTACVKKGLTDSCSEDADCADVDNAECDTNCVCMAKYRSVSDACVLTIGSSCSDVADCTGVSNTACTSDKCACADNYGAKNNDCVMRVTGTDCTSNTQCTADFSECGDNSKCKCKSGYKENIDVCDENGADGLSANIGMLCSMLIMLGLVLKL